MRSDPDLDAPAPLTPGYWGMETTPVEDVYGFLDRFPAIQQFPLTHERPCGCRKPHPPKSRSQFVLVNEATESVRSLKASRVRTRGRGRGRAKRRSHPARAIGVADGRCSDRRTPRGRPRAGLV